MSVPQSAKEKIGIWSATSLVVGNMIGAGIFLIPATMASFGGIGLVGWIVSSVGTILLALVFSRLSKILPAANGGPYAYTRAAFGDFTGFIVAWGYYISIIAANAAIAVAFVSALSLFVPALSSSPGTAATIGLASIWLLTWVNTRGMATAGAFQLVTTLLKIVPLLLVGIGGLLFINYDHFIPFNNSDQSSSAAIMGAASLTMFAFLGVECATIPSGSVKDPEKTIPRATIFGTILVAVVYILGTASVMGIVPSEQLQNSNTPFADAAVKILGMPGRYFVGAGVIISAFGALNGWILIQGQVPMAMANDKLFPSVFGKQNKHGSPQAGIIISSLIVSVFMLMNYSRKLTDQFQFLILLSTLTALVPYLFSTAALLLLKRKDGMQVSNTTIAVRVLSLLCFAYVIWMIAGCGFETVYWGFILMMLGIPIYVWIKQKVKPEEMGEE